MLLTNVNFNSKTNQKAAFKSLKTAEKQNSQIISSETVNFKGAEKMKVINLPKPRRSSFQVITLPVLKSVPDELKTFLTKHQNIFEGLTFEKEGETFAAKANNPWQAEIVHEKYYDAVNAALTDAAQKAKPTPTGVKVFLAHLLTLRTKIFPFDLQHIEGKIQLMGHPRHSSFFLDPANEREFLNEINPKLDDYLLEHGLGDSTKISLPNGKNYQVWLKTEKAEAAIDGKPFKPEAKILKGIMYQEQI